MLVLCCLLPSAPAALGQAAPTQPPTSPAQAQAVPGTEKPLDLRVGKLRPFLAPEEWFTPLPREIDEVIVRGRRQPGEIPYRKEIPQGLGGLFWGAANPTQAWRLLAPDLNVQVPPRDVDSPREPPGAYRARIGAPGRIF